LSEYNSAFFLKVCILLCTYVARFWGRRDTRDTGSFLVGERTVLLSVTQRFYVLGTPYCIYRNHKICCKPILRQERKIWLTANGPLCMRNDWPQRTLPST